MEPNNHTLPDANSPSLHLAHPTDTENLSIWRSTANSWKDALTESIYLKESFYLTTVPLAKDGGMTSWVLVDKNLPPNQRPLLASCETFRKRSWISTNDEYGVNHLTESITHGVASVYCDSKYRGRGYASRLMKELAKTLPAWQTETVNCVASVLFSDIGKEFHTRLGWRAFPSYHIEFPPCENIPRLAKPLKPLLAGDLEQLRKKDEELSRKAMIDSWSPNNKKTKFMIVPDHDHILWHHSKEEFATQTLFQKTPRIKGAITGEPGNRVWAIWTHRFYEPPSTASNNVLYILRLVVENQSGSDNQPQKVEQLKTIISTAQAEAADWGLHHVEIWDPSPQVQEWIKLMGVSYREVHRQEKSISSLLWYGPGSGTEDSIEWVSNEKYAWC